MSTFISSSMTDFTIMATSEIMTDTANSMPPTGQECFKCPEGCSECGKDFTNAVGDISCYTCEKGYQLMDSLCAPCDEKCLDCYNNQCFECITGLYLDVQAISS